MCFIYSEKKITQLIFITYVLLPAIQINFLRLQNWIGEINRVCYCPTGVKCEEKPVSSSLLLCLICQTHLGVILPGKHWDDRSKWNNVGQMQTCNSSSIFRLQNGITRHAQIFLFESILGLASCPVFICYWKRLATLQLLKASFQLCDTPISC